MRRSPRACATHHVYVLPGVHLRDARMVPDLRHRHRRHGRRAVSPGSPARSRRPAGEPTVGAHGRRRVRALARRHRPSRPGRTSRTGARRADRRRARGRGVVRPLGGEGPRALRAARGRVTVLPLRTRGRRLARREVVAALDDAAMLFFSGGNPWRLAEACGTRRSGTGRRSGWTTGSSTRDAARASPASPSVRTTATRRTSRRSSSRGSGTVPRPALRPALGHRGRLGPGGHHVHRRLRGPPARP